MSRTIFPGISRHWRLSFVAILILLAEKLGDFHDLCVVLSFVAPVYIEQVIIGYENEKSLAAIKERIETEKHNAKEEIVLLFEDIKKQIWVENTIKNICETS